MLGVLPEAERAELADRYFHDEELFDQLLEVENELLDQYVRGQLSADDQRSFRAYLSILPGSESKLATAFALMEATADRKAATASLAAIGPTPINERVTARTAHNLLWKVFRSSISGDRTLRYATAAMLLVMVAALAYLSVTERRLRREVERLQVERGTIEQAQVGLAAKAQAAEQQQATQRDLIQGLEKELAQAKQLQEHQSGTGGGVLATLFLTPPLRSGGTPDSLVLLPATKTVLLAVPVDNKEQSRSYRAVLQTTAGGVILKSGGLHPHKSPRGASIALRLPVSVLKGDHFKLTIIGMPTEGVEIARDYYFALARK